MTGDVIEFFPKYSTLPTGTFYSDPYDLTAYRSLVIEVGNAAVINSADISGTLQESGDLVSWVDLGSFLVPSAGTTASADYTNTARWIRFRIIVGGTNATATVWAKGVAREA